MTQAPPASIRPVPLREAFWYWLRLGFISFGGPAGQIAIMHEDLVERRRWISEARAAGSGNGWASAGKGMTPAIAHIAFPPSPRHIAFIPA